MSRKSKPSSESEKLYGREMAQSVVITKLSIKHSSKIKTKTKVKTLNLKKQKARHRGKRHKEKRKGSCKLP